MQHASGFIREPAIKSFLVGSCEMPKMSYLQACGQTRLHPYLLGKQPFPCACLTSNGKGEKYKSLISLHMLAT